MQVEPLVESGSVEEWQDPYLSAPRELILQLSRLALRCTAMPTLSRPPMRGVLGELEALRVRHIGPRHDRHAASVDMDLPKRRVENRLSLAEDIRNVDMHFSELPS